MIRKLMLQLDIKSKTKSNTKSNKNNKKGNKNSLTTKIMNNEKFIHIFNLHVKIM